MQIQTEGEESSRLRVLEIVGNAIVGGMEHYVRNLISQLPRERYHVTCLSPFESPFTRSLREYGCPVIITPIADDPPWRNKSAAVEVTNALSKPELR